MCDPTVMFAASAGIAGLQAIAGYQGQSAAYSQSLQQSQLNQGLAKQSALSQYSALALRQTQEREAVAASIDDTARRAAEARATARVSAGEAGVAGASVDALLADYTRQEYDFQTRSQLNLKGLDTQFAQENKAIQLGLQSNLINSQPIAKPSFANAAIGFGAQTLGAFQSSYYDPYLRKYVFG